MSNNIDILRKVDFLQSLDELTLEKISELFKEKVYTKGSILFEEGEIGDIFYVVKKGKVSLTKRIKSTEGELSFFGPYEYFGELALIDEEPRSATAITFDDSVMLSINKKDFLQVCKENPEVLLSIVKTMSSRLRATNEMYIEMWDELIKKNKLAAVGTAASKIVHDIKNPLTIIVLTSQMIERIFEGSSELAQKITAQVGKVNDMVKEILEFARGEAIGLDIVDININKFIEELSEEYTPIAEVKSTDVIVDSSVDDTVLRFDKDKIGRVIMNLINNAIEAFDDEPGEIYLTANLEGSWFHLSVIDNGPGIHEKYLDTLFEPFVTHKKKSGTGLGLAICKKIVTDHNGKMTVKNHEKAGAQFDIYIPALYRRHECIDDD